MEVPRLWRLKEAMLHFSGNWNKENGELSFYPRITPLKKEIYISRIPESPELTSPTFNGELESMAKRVVKPYSNDFLPVSTQNESRCKENVNPVRSDDNEEPIPIQLPHTVYQAEHSLP